MFMQDQILVTFRNRRTNVFLEIDRVVKSDEKLFNYHIVFGFDFSTKKKIIKTAAILDDKSETAIAIKFLGGFH